MQEKQKPKLFLEKLYEMLENGFASNIIVWTDEKDAIKILNRQQLIRDILPNVFKQASYKSFTKQMNLYNFKSTKDENGFTIFMNQNFNHYNLNIPQIMSQKRIIKKTKKDENKKTNVYIQEHEDLKKQLMNLCRYQITLQNEIKTQIALQKHLFQRISIIRKCIYSRKENGLKRRRKIYNFFNQFFYHLKSPIVCQKFLLLNHDLICQCDNEEECLFNYQQIECTSPLYTPKSLCLFKKQSSIAQIPDYFYDEENKPKSFLQLTPEQQQQFIETIWDE